MRRCVRVQVQLLPPQLWGAEPRGRSRRVTEVAAAVVLQVLLGQGSRLVPLRSVLHVAELVVLVCRGAFFLIASPLSIYTFFNSESVLSSSISCTMA